MSKYIDPVAFRAMPLVTIGLVILNFTLMMLNIFIGSWFWVGVNIIALIASHIAFNRSFDAEKDFYDFVNRV